MEISAARKLVHRIGFARYMLARRLGIPEKSLNLAGQHAEFTYKTAGVILSFDGVFMAYTYGGRATTRRDAWLLLRLLRRLRADLTPEPIPTEHEVIWTGTWAGVRPGAFA